MSTTSRTTPGFDSGSGLDEQVPDAESMLSAALACAAAADSYVATDRWYAPGPVLMLLGRALELALKAHAVHGGATADSLRYRLGVELDVNLRHALATGLLLDPAASERDWSKLRARCVPKDMRTRYFPDVMAGPARHLELRQLLGRAGVPWSIRGEAFRARCAQIRAENRSRATYRRRGVASEHASTAHRGAVGLSCSQRSPGI
jgi:hypothetical protein